MVEKHLEKIKDKPLINKLELFSLKNKFKPGEPLLLHDEPIFKKKIKSLVILQAQIFSFAITKISCLAYINGEINDCENLYIEVEGEKYALNFEKNPLHDPTSRLMRN